METQCREGGEYNTRKGNNPGLLWKAFEPLDTLFIGYLISKQNNKESAMTNQISTQVISFHGSELITLKVDDVIYTAVRPIVEG